MAAESAGNDARLMIDVGFFSTFYDEPSCHRLDERAPLSHLRALSKERLL